MKKEEWHIVQLGDNRQCTVNGVPGWHYCVGFQNQHIRSGSKHWYTCALNGALAYGSLNTWQVHPEHRTNFSLTITF